MTIRPIFIAALAVAATLSACGRDEDADNQAATARGGNPAAAAPSPGEALPAQTIAQGLGASAEHSALLGALRAAGLEPTLAGPGPYTLFAPANAAFEALPAGTAARLMQPEEKARLTAILTYHIVPGVVTAADLARAVEAAGGKAVLATLGGGNLTVTGGEGDLVVIDATGTQARLIGPNGLQSNGVIHGIDTVLMPRDGPA